MAPPSEPTPATDPDARGTRPTLLRRIGRQLAMWCALLGVMYLLAGGCNDDSLDKPTITLAQADAQLEQLIVEAAAQLPPGAELKRSSSIDAMPCADTWDINTGQVSSEVHYQIMHPDTWTAGQVFDILDQYWKSKGYRLHRDDRDDPTIADLWVRDPRTRIDIGIMVYPRTSSHFDAYLTGGTPCVWEFGTPSPRP